MVRGLSLWILTAAALITTAGRTTAWNDTGHRVIALIAYEVLDDATQKKVQEVLKHHPHYAEYLAKDVPVNADRAEWIAMNAATWPDWVRAGPAGRTRFHRGPWHYVNRPYIAVEPADLELRAEIEAKFGDPKTNHGDLLWVIPECQRLLRAKADTDGLRAEQAVRLCWLFHLVGDIHQPLHAVARCDKALPGGDRGGNSVWVTRKGDSYPKRLHAVWDDLLGRFEGHDALKGLARLVQSKNPVTAEERTVTAADLWSIESLALAKAHAYEFNGKPIECVVDAGTQGPKTAPPLPEGYEAQAAQVARKQVALAGIRLADLLKATLTDLGGVQR